MSCAPSSATSHPGGQSALAVRVRATGTAHPPGRQLCRADRWRDRKARARLARTCCATLVAITLPTWAPCRTTPVTEIPTTPLITPVLPGTDLKACGCSCERNDWTRPHDASARALLRLVGAAFSGFPLSVLRPRNWHSAPANELVKPGQDYLQVFQNVKEGTCPSRIGGDLCCGWLARSV
jgi:hypothetical protein